MRAVVVDDFGAEPHVAEVPDPVPAPGEVLVRVRAAALNPFDWKVIDGALRGAVQHRFPLTLGSDGAGVVTALGPDVNRFIVGDRVYGQFLQVSRGRGSFADYAVLSETGKLARLSEAVPFDVAAAMPTASVAAYQAVTAAALSPGDLVLVNGASGGVGQSAVQFAAEIGATVVATAPPELADHMRALGAAQVVDFTAGPTAEQVHTAHPEGVSAVIDLVSRPGDAAVLSDLVRAGGVFVSTNNAAEAAVLATRQVRGINLDSRVTQADLAALAERVAAGKLQVQITDHVRLEDVPDVIAAARAGQARGKTVIVLD